jgi:hypothetical protein
MFIKDHEKAELLRSFPNIELSYETIVHKKVYNYDFVVAIPEGMKYFVWFTIFRDQNVCLLLEISEHKQISNIEVVPCCFKDNLCYGAGTILYGTLFLKDSIRFFACENIFYCSGASIDSKKTMQKYYYLHSLLKNDLNQLCYFENSIFIGLPLMKKGDNCLLKEVSLLPYKISCFHYVNHNYKTEIKSLSYGKVRQNSTPEKEVKREKVIVFKVKPDLQNDIYHLYTADDHYMGVGYISNYNNSVMMNNLFRNIKENQNLDALEESDDEEEFQDDRIDKYVYLDRELNMACTYNHKFKKWEPLRVANEGKGEKLAFKKDLYYMEKNKA